MDAEEGMFSISAILEVNEGRSGLGILVGPKKKLKLGSDGNVGWSFSNPGCLLIQLSQGSKICAVQG